MSKWTDERSWRVSMYIGYVLCFIILSVAGYNGIMMLVGDVTLFMRVILLICVCLFVAFGVFLFFSVVITPFSEILNRLAVYLFKRDHYLRVSFKDYGHSVKFRLSQDEAWAYITAKEDGQRELLKRQFAAKYLLQSKDECRGQNREWEVGHGSYEIDDQRTLKR